jgi:hypothetical protein
MMNNEKPHLHGFVPIPNFLFDEILPTLTDSELRVLLVVMRATLGFREGSDTGGTRFRRRAWIAHNQLQMRAGRSSTSMSQAVQSLVARQMIVVENERGLPLPTADERRRNMGRLFYRPGDIWWISPKGIDIGKVRTIRYKGEYIHRGSNTNSTHAPPPPRTSSGFERIGAIVELRE